MPLLHLDSHSLDRMCYNNCWEHCTLGKRSETCSVPVCAGSCPRKQQQPLFHAYNLLLHDGMLATCASHSTKLAQLSAWLLPEPVFSKPSCVVASAYSHCNCCCFPLLVGASTNSSQHLEEQGFCDHTGVTDITMSPPTGSLNFWRIPQSLIRNQIAVICCGASFSWWLGVNKNEEERLSAAQGFWTRGVCVRASVQSCHSLFLRKACCFV